MSHKDIEKIRAIVNVSIVDRWDFPWKKKKDRKSPSIFFFGTKKKKKWTRLLRKSCDLGISSRVTWKRQCFFGRLPLPKCPWLASKIFALFSLFSFMNLFLHIYPIAHPRNRNRCSPRVLASDSMDTTRVLFPLTRVGTDYKRHEIDAYIWCMK